MDDENPDRERPAHPVAAFLVRWRWVLYALIVLAALALARAGIEARHHAPPPPDVESDD